MKAVDECAPDSEETDDTPRVKLWKACELVSKNDVFWTDGMNPIYTANALVAFLFNTITPIIEERIRTDILNTEVPNAHKKGDSAAQNLLRLNAFFNLYDTERTNSFSRPTSVEYAKMREAMAILTSSEIKNGLSCLYVTGKKARKAIDMIFEKMIHTFQHDNDIIVTSEIPMDAMFGF
jgi:hypothetical protein